MQARSILKMVILGTALAGSCFAEATQVHAAFAQAIKEQSTSPYFVEIRVVDARVGRTFSTCVTANLFLGALHIEHAFPYDEAGTKSAENFALSQASTAFQFKSAKALRNMPWHPSAKELAEARDFVSTEPKSSLGRALLSTFYENHDRRRERMGALACALIDKGLTPRMADLTGTLYVSSEPSNRSFKVTPLRGAPQFNS